MYLRFITNDTDKISINNITPRIGESIYDAIKFHLKWRNKYIKGRPQATGAHTAEELERMGIIGLYEKCEDE